MRRAAVEKKEHEPFRARRKVRETWRGNSRRRRGACRGGEAEHAEARAHFAEHLAAREDAGGSNDCLHTPVPQRGVILSGVPRWAKAARNAVEESRGMRGGRFLGCDGILRSVSSPTFARDDTALRMTREAGFQKRVSPHRAWGSRLVEFARIDPSASCRVMMTGG